jgi:hypothetical protein
VNVGVRVAISAACLSGIAAACSSHHELRPRPADSVRPHALPIVAAIARAKATDSHLFVIFPGIPGTRACEIPDGGLVLGRLRGTCRSSVRALPGNSGFTIVSFTEVWPTPCRKKCRFHRWAITEGPSGRPLATHNVGDVAPQNYY